MGPRKEAPQNFLLGQEVLEVGPEDLWRALEAAWYYHLRHKNPMGFRFRGVKTTGLVRPV